MRFLHDIREANLVNGNSARGGIQTVNCEPSTGTGDDAAVEESDKEKPGVIPDYDKGGDIVGIENLSAAHLLRVPSTSDSSLP